MDDLAEQLPSEPIERVKLLDELAEHHPEVVRAFIERHPANLMVHQGLNVEPFHADALNDILTERRTFWLAPRGSGKSTNALMACTWMALADPANMDPSIGNLFPKAPHTIGPHNIRIALTGNSADKAEELHWQAKQTLIDPRITNLFGNLEGKRWTNTKSETSLRSVNLREGTFTAMGLGSKVTGGHYDVVLADDYVTLDNARTELQRTRITDFWKFTVKPTHEPWARTIGAGTRYHPGDWYQTVKGWADDGDWKLRLTPAITKGIDGQDVSYWPQVFDLETLKEIKREIGAIAFATQYQNQVDLLLGEFFDNEWVERFARWADLPEASRAKARTVICLDPSIKAGLRNDYSVFVVLSYIAPHFYVRNVVRGQWTQEELVARSQYLMKVYKPEQFGVENVGGIEFLVQAIKKAPGMHGKVRSMRPTSTAGKDKVGRASEVRRFFENLRVYLEEPTEHNGIHRLIEEMMAFPTAHNVPGMDDCVDALVWAMLLMSRQSSRVGRTGKYRRRH
jgi:predicted phage terminase large subunit-like protein